MRAALLLLLAVAVARAGDTGVIEGRVLDPDGNGVEGATVTAYCVSTEEPLDEVSAKTDKLGAFRFEGLAAGKYILALPPKREEKKKGTMEEEIAKAIFGDAFKKLGHTLLVKNAPGHPHLVEVEAGKTATHDIRIPREIPVTLVFTRGGKPYRGAEVSLSRLNLRGDASWSVSVGGRKPPRTDGEGRVSFDAVPEGRYAVHAEVGDWSVGCGTVAVEGTEALTLPVAVGDREIRIRVLDSRGSPVKKAEPGAAGPGEWVGVQRKAFTEDMESQDGVYRIPYIREGRYEAYLNTGTVHACSDPIEIVANAADPEVVLTLPPTGRIVVRVVDASGKPLKSYVTLQHPSGTPSWGEETDRKGVIAFDYVGTGAWRLGLRDEGNRDFAVARDVEVEESKETAVELKAK